MSLTKAGKNDFSIWVEQTLIENKLTIEAANPDVTFDVEGYVTLIGLKKAAYVAEIGKGTALNQAKLAQTKVAKSTLNDFYTTSSLSIDSVCGYLGSGHPLSILMRQKRDGMSNVANRGKRKPKA